MDCYEKEMIAVVNRHHACVAAVDRISKNLDCDMLARKLNAISAGRRNKHFKSN